MSFLFSRIGKFVLYEKSPADSMRTNVEGRSRFMTAFGAQRIFVYTDQNRPKSCQYGITPVERYIFVDNKKKEKIFFPIAFLVIIV